MASDTPIRAVLTGDLIDSRKLAGVSLAKTQRVIRDATAEFEQAIDVEVVGRPEFFRGDAWQLLLDDPARALRLALLLRAQLRWKTGVDTRIAIGIGATQSINRRKISLSAGEAFELSGHALDAMTGYFSLTAAIPGRIAAGAEWLPIVAHLCSDLVRGWTPRQAEIVSYALLQPAATHEELGLLLNKRVKKQTVTSALRSAHFRALSEALMLFESTDWSARVTRATRPSKTA